MKQPDDADYQTVTLFLEQIRDTEALEDATLHEMCVQLDRMPSIRSRILSEANAASTGAWHRIDNVHHATMRLGLRRIEQILGKFVTSTNRVPPAPHFGHRAAS